MPLQIPQQELFSPVTNYYKGKAIRQDLATAKKQEELLDLQIAEAKKPPQVDQKELDRRSEFTRDALAEASAAAVLQAREGAPPEEYTATFNATLAQALGPEATAAMQQTWDRNGDGVLGESEIAELESFAIARGQELQEGLKPTSNQQVLDDLVDQGHISQQKRNEILESQQIKSGTITGTTEFDPRQDPRTPTQRGAAHAENLGAFNDSSSVQELITDALPRVSELPGAVGVKGKIAVGGAGLLTTFGQEEAANRFAQSMSGADPEEIAAIQTQLQVIRSRIIPITTGEESSRISDNEREIANRTVGIIDSIRGPADLTKAYPQVMGAMTQLYVESWANKFGIAKRDEAIGYPYDLSNDAEVEDLVDEFIDAGIEENTIKQALTRLAKIQGISP